MIKQGYNNKGSKTKNSHYPIEKLTSVRRIGCSNNRDSKVLIGQAKLFDISTANQNQGSKCIRSPLISRLARKKARFTEGSLSFGRAF